MYIVDNASKVPQHIFTYISNHLWFFAAGARVCIIYYCVAAHRSMWTVTNYFLLNLTVSDIMMATFNCIPSFIYMRDR